MTTSINFADLAEQIRRKCQRESWYGPEDFRLNQRGRAWSEGSTWAASNFWCPPATQRQIDLTEELLGFELPRSLVFLYTALSNGGFGPGAGLRGLVGGYGTRYTAVPNGETFLNEESIVKCQYRQLVPLSGYSWQQQGEARVLRLPADHWPQGLFPICDLGDCMEVCLDKDSRVFYWYASAENGFYEVEASPLLLENWLLEWITMDQAGST